MSGKKETIQRIKEAMPEYEPYDQKVMEDMIGVYQHAKALVEFRNNPIIDDFCQHLQREIAQCKEQLSENQELTESHRNELFTRKKVYKEFLDMFDGAADAIANIEEEVPNL